jgi:hypothetical protein
MEMDVNHIFELLHKNEYDSFIRYYKKHETEIQNNKVLTNPLTILMKELEDDTESLKNNTRTKGWLDALYGAHSGKILPLADEILERLTVCLIKNYKDSNLDFCKKIANKFPNNQSCKDILEYESEEQEYESGKIIKLFHTGNSNEDLRVPTNSKIGIKEKYKESILKTLRYLRPSTYKPVTISQLYVGINSESHDFEDKQMYYDYLRELRDEGIIYFKDTSNGCPVYFTR